MNRIREKEEYYADFVEAARVIQAKYALKSRNKEVTPNRALTEASRSPRQSIDLIQKDSLSPRSISHQLSMG